MWYLAVAGGWVGAERMGSVEETPRGACEQDEASDGMQEMRLASADIFQFVVSVISECLPLYSGDIVESEVDLQPDSEQGG